MNLLKNIYLEAELGSVLADAQKKFDFYIKNDFSSNEKKKSLHATCNSATCNELYFNIELLNDNTTWVQRIKRQLRKFNRKVIFNTCVWLKLFFDVFVFVFVFCFFWKAIYFLRNVCLLRCVDLHFMESRRNQLFE